MNFQASEQVADNEEEDYINEKHPLSDNSQTNLYKKAGVDVAAGEAFARSLSPFAGASQRKGAACHLGGFGGIFDLKAIAGDFQDPLLISATDGVGTKLVLAKQIGKLDGLGQDLVAMSVNDIIAQGAEPLFFLDYIACGKLDAEKMSAIVGGISKACIESGCALIGGETAEMPEVYQADAFDLAGFAVGAVERERLLPNSKAQAGDIVLGLASNGIHSNGFSLVRSILKSNGLERDEALIKELLAPTRLYVKPVLALLRSKVGQAVRGIAHITGGGLIENPPRSLPNPNLRIVIDYKAWTMPEIFHTLQKAGKVPDAEMHGVFNCGIGLTLIVEKAQLEAVKAQLEASGEKIFTIGEVR